jgi:hypothetical protein
MRDQTTLPRLREHSRRKRSLPANDSRVGREGSLLEVVEVSHDVSNRRVAVEQQGPESGALLLPFNSAPFDDDHIHHPSE